METLRDQCRQLEEARARTAELGGKSEERIHSQQAQIDDLRQQITTKELESSKFDGTIQELTKHITALESNASEQKDRMVKAEADRHQHEEHSKVAAQQAEMLREVTRQLYAKLTAQTDTNNCLAEAKSEIDLKCNRTQMELESLEQQLRTESNNRAATQAKLAQLKTDMAQLAAQHAAAVQHADSTAARLQTEVANREGLQKRYRRLHQKFMALSTETSSLLTDLELTDNHRTDDERYYRPGRKSRSRGGSSGAARPGRTVGLRSEEDSS